VRRSQNDFFGSPGAVEPVVGAADGREVDAGPELVAGAALVFLLVVRLAFAFFVLRRFAGFRADGFRRVAAFLVVRRFVALRFAGLRVAFFLRVAALRLAGLRVGFFLRVVALRVAGLRVGVFVSVAALRFAGLRFAGLRFAAAFRLAGRLVVRRFVAGRFALRAPALRALLVRVDLRRVLERFAGIRLPLCVPENRCASCHTEGRNRWIRPGYAPRR
jgi:hypothetical protein